MAGGYSVTITAVDRASKQIRAVNNEIARMRGPVDRVQKELTRFADLTGISKLSRGMGNLGRAGFDAFRNIGRIVEPLAAITSAVSIAGMFRLVTAWSQFGTASQLAARRIGLSVDQLQSLQGAAALSGSTADALTSGIETLGQTLYDAVGGRAPQAVVMLNTLGISFRDAAGHARSVTDVLPELADKIASMSNPYDQLRAATALLGGSARDLLPFLQRGSAGIAEYNAMAQHYGVMNQGAAEAARQLRFEQVKLNLATTGLTNSIALALAPTLGPLLDHMAEWIQANRDWIATDIGGAVKQVGDYLENHDWKADIKSIEGFATTADNVTKAFGGWKTVVEGIIALKLLGWVTNLLGPLATLIRLLALIPGSGVGASAAVVAGGAVLGYKGAVKSGTTTGHAAELGLSASTLPGSMDEFGNVNLFSGPDGKTYTPDEVEKMYAAKHPEGAAPAAGGGGILGRIGRFFGIGGGDSGPTGLGNPGPDGATRAAREKQAVDYYKSQGWSATQAASLAGGIQGESGFDPAARGDPVNGVKTAFGIGQWHMDRVQKILDGSGIDVRTADYPHQLQAQQWELTHSEKAAGDALRATNTLEGGSRALVTKYERSAEQDKDAAVRTGYAATAFNQYGADEPPAAVAPTPPANVNNGTGSSSPDVTHTVNGQANVRIDLSGAPPGTTTTSNATGDLFTGPPRIHYAMSGAG